ncbi:MAG: MFS transporter [Eubacteriaceae bacterium]|nr:MFS transporter [Eubacteriaceae bacterium]
MAENSKTKPKLSRAVQVIIVFGLISLFADIVYEGARSATGQYLQLLGANATIVGLIVGFGEFLAYALRLFAGTASDRSKNYWLFIFAGYGMLLVVPLIGVASSWHWVLVLMMCERIGKALRNPSKDTILSHVAEGEVGTGFAFGLQEALDQLGAFSGPLVFSVMFWLSGRQGIAEYKRGFLYMAFPFVVLMLVVYSAYRMVTKNQMLEVEDRTAGESEKMAKVFWIYTAFTFFSLLGFTQFALIGYHLKAQAILPDVQITLMYSITMAIDAFAAIAIGFIYDRVKKKTGNKQGGLLTLLFIPAATALIPFLALGNSIPMVVAGLVCYGIVMGAHETVMRSAIADITPLRKRGTGYGIFNTAYGVALLMGTSLFGILYDNVSIFTIQMVIVAAELIAVGVFIVMSNQIKKETLLQNAAEDGSSQGQ